MTDRAREDGDLPFTTTELIARQTATPDEILETLGIYAARAHFVLGAELVAVIERATPPPMPEDYEELQRIAGQGMVNARRHEGQVNDHPQYPDMVAAVQAGYATIFGYAGQRLVELAA